jgi:hypothetical protein
LNGVSIRFTIHANLGEYPITAVSVFPYDEKPTMDSAGPELPGESQGHTPIPNYA